MIEITKTIKGAFTIRLSKNVLFSFEENTKKMHPKCSFRTPACYVITKIMNNDVYGKRCSEDRMTESTVLHCMGGRARKKKMLSHPLKWHPLAKDKSQGWRRRRRYRSDFLCRRPIPPPRAQNSIFSAPIHPRARRTQLNSRQKNGGHRPAATEEAVGAGDLPQEGEAHVSSNYKN